jgi:hypothetical protein
MLLRHERQDHRRYQRLCAGLSMLDGVSRILSSPERPSRQVTRRDPVAANYLSLSVVGLTCTGGSDKSAIRF